MKMSFVSRAIIIAGIMFVAAQKCKSEDEIMNSTLNVFDYCELNKVAVRNLEYVMQQQIKLIDVLWQKINNECNELESNGTEEETSGTPPSSCSAALKNGNSGLYHLYLPEWDVKPFYAYCIKDPKGGPAWMLLQRREDGSQKFDRNWIDYKRGFGTLNSEFFIGLEKIYALTNDVLNELWFHLEDFDDQQKDAYYENFAISNEVDRYALNVLGEYSGDAGDALSYSGGQKFSARDSDNDEWYYSCPIQLGGGWWHKECTKCNLNGKYYRKNADPKNASSLYWLPWHGYRSLKYTHMAIRPKKV